MGSCSLAVQRAFTLLEVVVAIGVLAVTVVGVLALHVAIDGSVREIGAHDRAARLGPAIGVELRRLREAAVAETHLDGVEALARLLPANDSAQALRLAGSRDGLRVVRESEADNAVIGVVPRDRFYLIEVRQQPAPLAYVSGAGYLAAAVRVIWPYAAAPASGEADERTFVVVNIAIVP